MLSVDPYLKVTVCGPEQVRVFVCGVRSKSEVQEDGRVDATETCEYGRAVQATRTTWLTRRAGRVHGRKAGGRQSAGRR